MHASIMSWLLGCTQFSSSRYLGTLGITGCCVVPSSPQLECHRCRAAPHILPIVWEEGVWGGCMDVDRGILNGDREQHSAIEEKMAKSVTFYFNSDTWVVFYVKTIDLNWGEGKCWLGDNQNCDEFNPAAIASIGRERGTIMSLLNLTDTKKWPN